MKKPAVVYLLASLHLLLGINAVAGGCMLIAKPDGSLLGMEQGWLNASPFSNYLVPGILLLLVNGMMPLYIAAGLLRKFSCKWSGPVNIYPNRHWAWTFSLYTGITVIGWIIIQQLLTRYFWLQPAVAATGLLIIIVTMLPSVIRYYTE
ncbi:MAG: hypothetical protein U0V75_09110 [Ferruginibacter sp.]